MNIKGILITSLSTFENHIANGGEKLLGNASSIKRRPDGKVYVSGQMQRHVLFSAIERLNDHDENKGATFVSNGDGVSNKIESDLRADLGGFLHPSVGDYSGRRSAPLTVTPAVALSGSEVGRDLLLRLKFEDRDHSIATREYSQYDQMHMNFHLDISAVAISKLYKYEDKFNVETKFCKHTSESERLRRVRLFIEATRSMTDYANQARNAINAEPSKVLIVFDQKLSRKASKYFSSRNDVEKDNLLDELEKRGAKYFYGDDELEGKSVGKAYEDALTFLKQSTLYDPSEKGSNGKEIIQTFEEVFGKKEKE